MSAHLRLVDAQTGEQLAEESRPPYEELWRLYKRQQGELDGWRLRYGNLEKRLGEFEGQEPNAPKVREVLDFWADQMLSSGFFSRRPKVVPGSERWKHVRARLKERFTVPDLKLVPIGAMRSNFHSKNRAYVDAKSIYSSGEKVEQHIERALEGQVGFILAELREDRWAEFLASNLEYLTATCDCGHELMLHARPDRTMYGIERCLEPGCECVSFGTVCQDLTEYLVGQGMAREKAVAASGLVDKRGAA